MVGEGATGKVFLASLKTKNAANDLTKPSTPVAIKILDKKGLSRHEYGITNLL
jgi:serine/threonine protein kinase